MCKGPEEAHRDYRQWMDLGWRWGLSAPAGLPSHPQHLGFSGPTPPAALDAAPWHTVPGHGLEPPGYLPAATPGPVGAQCHGGHLSVSDAGCAHLCFPTQTRQMLCTNVQLPGPAPSGCRDPHGRGTAGAQPHLPTFSSLSHFRLCSRLSPGKVGTPIVRVHRGLRGPASAPQAQNGHSCGTWWSFCGSGGFSSWPPLGPQGGVDGQPSLTPGATP